MECENNHKSLVDMIQDLVQQSCGNDSAAITIYATAMRLLVAERRCKIVSECGQRVLVEWLTCADIKNQYEHYKGGLYDHLGTVINESNGEELALYRSTKTLQIFTRQHLEFFGDVWSFGHKVPRFRYIGDSDEIRHRVQLIRQQAQLTRSVDDLDMVFRSFNCLKSAGIFYVGDLVRKSEQELLKLPGLGRASLNDIKEALAKDGLALGMQVDKRNMEEEDNIVHGLEVVGAYMHYKGGHYYYLGRVMQESDGAALALYRSVDMGTTFVRPESEFFESVVVDGKEILRFQAEIRPNSQLKE